MDTYTKNINLTLTPEETSDTFLQWRTKINGITESNMTKIDAKFGEILNTSVIQRDLSQQSLEGDIIFTSDNGTTYEKIEIIKGTPLTTSHMDDPSVYILGFCIDKIRLQYMGDYATSDIVRNQFLFNEYSGISATSVRQESGYGSLWTRQIMAKPSSYIENADGSVTYTVKSDSWTKTEWVQVDAIGLREEVENNKLIIETKTELYNSGDVSHPTSYVTVWNYGLLESIELVSDYAVSIDVYKNDETSAIFTYGATDTVTKQEFVSDLKSAIDEGSVTVADGDTIIISFVGRAAHSANVTITETRLNDAFLSTHSRISNLEVEIETALDSIIDIQNEYIGGDVI